MRILDGILWHVNKHLITFTAVYAGSVLHIMDDKQITSKLGYLHSSVHHYNSMIMYFADPPYWTV